MSSVSPDLSDRKHRTTTRRVTAAGGTSDAVVDSLVVLFGSPTASVAQRPLVANVLSGALSRLVRSLTDRDGSPLR